MKGIRWYVKSTINIHKWWRTKDTQLTSFPKFGSWFFHQSTTLSIESIPLSQSLHLRHRMCLLRGRQANVLHNAALLAQLDSPAKKPIATQFFSEIGGDENLEETGSWDFLSLCFSTNSLSWIQGLTWTWFCLQVYFIPVPVPTSHPGESIFSTKGP